MPKNLKNVIKTSLTCALILCASVADARRMNPELMKPPPSQLPSEQAPPAGIMCRDCNVPIKPVPQSQRVWQPQVNDLATWQQLSRLSHDFEFTKFVLDIKSNKIYFVDSNVFTLHADFCCGLFAKNTAHARKYAQLQPKVQHGKAAIYFGLFNALHQANYRARQQRAMDVFILGR